MVWARAGSRLISTRKLARVLNSMCGSSWLCSRRNWFSAARRRAAWASARACDRRSAVLSTTTATTVATTLKAKVMRVLLLARFSMLGD